MDTEQNTTARRLSYFTVGYNLLEGVASIAAGILAGSIALLGFGFDSAIESTSGAIMIWRFRQRAALTEEEEERIEKQAARLVAISFFVLAAYIAWQSFSALYFAEKPEPSLFGIIVAAVSLVVMPWLFLRKYRLGKKIGSNSLVADSKQTLACVMLSAALFVGLGLNYLFGLWQADPIAGLVIGGFLVREGIVGLVTQKTCGCTH